MQPLSLLPLNCQKQDVWDSIGVLEGRELGEKEWRKSVLLLQAQIVSSAENALYDGTKAALQEGLKPEFCTKTQHQALQQDLH